MKIIALFDECKRIFFYSVDKEIGNKARHEYVDNIRFGNYASLFEGDIIPMRNTGFANSFSKPKKIGTSRHTCPEEFREYLLRFTPSTPRRTIL